ncbi:hypothetical protein BD310DRAFT_141448 [Dichomitus squalens]|uniref:DUF6534 domain-containing protein n=1 Tax=Dichomitus squalens TaxID=114155 RepID=A0A4Q9PF51_9APHY|nr:hypothetical protein BD310DRAFT_141448 [Dichomitus squalens]
MGLFVLELGFFIATAEAFLHSAWSDHHTWLISTSTALGAASDAIVTGVLVCALRRSRTGIKRTDNVLEVVILYSMNTGLLTGIVNLLCLYGFIRPEVFTFLGIAIPGSRVYTVSLLAALNSRQSLLERFSDTIVLAGTNQRTLQFNASSTAPEENASVEDRITVQY